MIWLDVCAQTRLKVADANERLVEGHSVVRKFVGGLQVAIVCRRLAWRQEDTVIISLL